MVEHFAGEDENHQQTPEEVLAAALADVPDEKLTSFALRLALTGYVDVPRENDFDFLAEAAAVFVPPAPVKAATAKKKAAKPAPKKGVTAKKPSALKKAA